LTVAPSNPILVLLENTVGGYIMGSMIRKVDELGRIVIPKEVRRNLMIADLDPLEYFVSGDEIILQKYKRGCIFCSGMDGLQTLNEIPVCENCVSAIADRKLEEEI